MPPATPGSIVINEDSNPRTPSAPIVVPGPEPPNIYFTTHPSKSYQQTYCNSIAGNTCPQNYGQPQFEMPKVYALPPGVLPAQYFQNIKKCS